MDVMSFAIGFEGGYQEGQVAGGGVTPEEKAYWNSKQEELVSGANIKTLNGQSVLGAGDIVVSGGGDISTHIESTVYQAPTHGLQINSSNKLEYFNGLQWTEVVSKALLGVGEASDLSVSLNGINAAITWTDPNDFEINGTKMASWYGTKILRKTTGFPENENDGVLVVNSGVRNQYSVSGFIDTGLVKNQTYYYKAFPYTTENTYTIPATGMQYTHILPSIFGVSIDLTNSNPLTAVTYTDDSIGMIAGSASWDALSIFKDIKPCMFKNGVVQYYLNPNDFTKKADGSAADITSGNDGDVMIEFPKFGYKIETVGNAVKIQITDASSFSGFKYYAHTRTTDGDKDKFYIGAYLGYKDANSKLRSLSGKTPTVSQVMNTFRTQSQANGTGYDIVGFYQVTAIQCLYLIKYKHLNSQIALGSGYVGGSKLVATGGTNAKGMNFGGTSTQQIKLFGIEDFWGNAFWLMDGLFLDGSRNILTAFSGFNDYGTSYTNRGQAALTNGDNYMSKPQGTTETGFIGKELNGSETTYFSDYISITAHRQSWFGGSYSSANSGGIFSNQASVNASSSYAVCGARIMYL